MVLTTLGQPGAAEFDDKIVTVVDAMGRTAAGQPIPPGRISAFAIDVGQHPWCRSLGAVLYGLGSLAIFLAMAYLFRATAGGGRASRSSHSSWPRWAPSGSGSAAAWPRSRATSAPTTS